MKFAITNRRGRPTLAITLLLASLSMVSPLSIDTFLPSFPTIAGEFGLSTWEVQQIITAYMLPYAVFSLVHGPLSDALGRRRMVIGGVGLYTVGTLGCFLAPSFGVLLACRMLQGIAAGAGPTVARAVVRDLFDGPNAQRLMSGTMLVFSLAPAIAPVMGGWVHVALGWRWVFGMLVVMGLALAAVCAWGFPETLPRNRRTVFHPVELARSCWRVGSHPAFLLMSLAAGLSTASLVIYIGAAPAIVLDQWQLQETQFHYVFIPIVAGFMVGAFISGRLAGRLPRHRQFLLGYGLLGFSVVANLLAHVVAPDAPMLVSQALWVVMAMGTQIIYPVMSLDMLDMYPDARGAAASVQSFVALCVGAVAMGMVAPLLDGNLTLLALASLLGALLSFLAWGVALRSQAKEGLARV